jgi:diguanylate cyclase (GGDEF)-like protein
MADTTAAAEVSLDRAHLVSAIAVIGLIIIAGLLAIPYGGVSLGVSPGFLPAFGSLTFMGDLITAVLLFSHARASNDKTQAYLGCAYLFSATIIIPHLMAFPGVFSPDSLIGASASAVWLWAFWHAGFALGVLNFAVRKPAPGDVPIALGPFILGTVAVAGAAADLATLGLPILPTILINGSYARLTSLGISPAVLVCGFAGLVAVLRLLRRRDASILTIWLAVAMVASVVDVSLTMLGSQRFTLGWYLARCLSLVAGFSVLCALLTESVRLFTKAAKANRYLEKLSLTDPLTDIANRRSFEQRLDLEWRRAMRDQRPVSLVMIDIDHFKRYNDRFGHPAGDTCLRTVAASLTQHARRPWDMPARLGGEEFAVLLPETEQEGAAKVAELFRASVEGLRLPHPDNASQVVTISVGVATAYPCEAGQSPARLVAAADAALYVAKTTGRNRVHQHAVPGQQEMIDGVLRHVGTVGAAAGSLAKAA